MAPRKPRAPKAAALPPRLPAGLVMSDLTRHSWRLGDPIGSGGFGQIYSASPESAASSASGGQYVIKVEAHASGPLFSEMHCYHRVARAETIAAWQKKRGLKRFGMPRFVGSGSFDHGGLKYRFMVIERFGTDLQKLLEQNNSRFPMSTILHIGIQVLDVLEFIHSQEYIHGDIKGQNLLLGLGKETKDLVYLVDFGLACRYAVDGVHKEYKPDIRKAHNGTIEFTSRDAHIGAQSRRGDLEILGYNLLQWASGALPWMDRLQSADRVAEEKNRLMANVPALVKTCFPGGLPKSGEAIQRFLAAVAALRFEEKPDYAALRGILQAGLKALGSPPERLVFTTDTAASRPAGRGGRDRSPLHSVQESDVPRRRPAAAKKPGRGRAARAAAAARSSEHSSEEEGSEEEPQRLVNGAGKGGRRGRAAANYAEEQDGSDDEPQPLVNGASKGARKGRARGKKRTSEESLEDGEEAGPAPAGIVNGGKRKRVNGKMSSARSSTITASTSTSSIYDNINSAMQEVLDRRARVAAEKASKAKPATAKLKPRPMAAAVSRAARGKGRTAAVASPASCQVSSPARLAAGRRVATPSARSGDDSEESFHTPAGSAGRRRSDRLSSGGAAGSPLVTARRGIRETDFSPELW